MQLEEPNTNALTFDSAKEFKIQGCFSLGDIGTPLDLFVLAFKDTKYEYFLDGAKIFLNL